MSPTLFLQKCRSTILRALMSCGEDRERLFGLVERIPPCDLGKAIGAMEMRRESLERRGRRQKAFLEAHGLSGSDEECKQRMASPRVREAVREWLRREEQLSL